MNERRRTRQAGERRTRGRWGRAAGALLGLTLGGWIAGAGCGARSELYLPVGLEDAGADALFDVPPTGAFCAEATYDSGPTELSMMVLLDRSGSMLDDNRWFAVSSALSAFVDDPGAAGLGIGLQYYPLSNTGSECDSGKFALPAVPMGKLPGNAEAVKASLAKVTPFGETPTLPALQGGIEYARGVLLANPKERVVIALVTDGAPNACSSTAAKVATLAQEAATTDPKVLTYVIGLATGYTDEMALMAAAGGTGKPILVDDGAAAAQTLVDAMLSVKTAQENCRFGVPIPAGAAPSAADLAVRYRTSPEAEAVALAIVADFASCSGEAYFPDDLDAPGSVTLCPAACALVHAADKSQVTVTTGCGLGSDGGVPDAKPDATTCPSLVDFSCTPSCDSSELTAPSCIDGAWTCPPGLVSTVKCTTCPAVPHGCCKGDGTFANASCVNGGWTCPPGTSIFGSPGCSTPGVCTAALPCPFSDYCDLPDDSCGKSDQLGTCVKVPGSCPPGAPKVCSCNGLVAASTCEAAADGFDISEGGGCPKPPLEFACGPYFCATNEQVCRLTTTLGAAVPESYACLDIPPGCGTGCGCKLCEVCPPNGPCGSCGPNSPGDPSAGALLECTQIGP